jgi:hypothetical protein
MPDHDLEKLLGGFAADTLTPDEKQALYAAALQDQPLFNALADEQALKELLSDPDVRRRLLASLERQRISGSGSALSWLDWFRRPAGLAFAGSLSVAALAVVLGVRVYQDSLNQAMQSDATEDGKKSPSTKITEPQTKTKEEAGPAKAPLPILEQSKEVASSADHTVAAGSPQPATSLESKQREAPAVSARALFYVVDPARQSQGRILPEKERTVKPLAEPTPRTNRPEGTLGGLSELGKAAGTLAPLKPLGLRYSFVVREADGQERTQPLFLTLEANQDAYLQIWKTVGSSTPQLQLPEKETGQVSLKITAGQRQYMQLPVGREPAILTAHLSLVPFGPIAKQEVVKFDRPSPHQIQESITERTKTGSQERATYVVNQDPSTNAQITVDIILRR